MKIKIANYASLIVFQYAKSLRPSYIKEIPNYLNDKLTIKELRNYIIGLKIIIKKRKYNSERY